MEPLDEPSNEGSAGARWTDRHRWLGTLLMAMFAGLAPAPAPKPTRALSEHHQKAEDKDIPNFDSDFVIKTKDGRNTRE